MNHAWFFKRFLVLAALAVVFAALRGLAGEHRDLAHVRPGGYYPSASANISAFPSTEPTARIYFVDTATVAFTVNERPTLYKDGVIDHVGTLAIAAAIVRNSGVSDDDDKFYERVTFAHKDLEPVNFTINGAVSRRSSDGARVVSTTMVTHSWHVVTNDYENETVFACDASFGDGAVDDTSRIVVVPGPVEDSAVIIVHHRLDADDATFARRAALWTANAFFAARVRPEVLSTYVVMTPKTPDSGRCVVADERRGGSVAAFLVYGVAETFVALIGY